MSSADNNYWENQALEYNNLVNSSVSLDFLTIMSKVQLKENNIKLSGGMKLNKIRKTESLTGLTNFSLRHTMNPFTNYTLTTENNKTTLNVNCKLLNLQSHYLSLYSLLNMNTNEDKMSFDLKAHLRYQYNNNTLISAGIEDYKHGKGKVPNQLSLYALHRYKVDNGLNILGGFYSGYLIKEGYMNFHKFLLSYKNGIFNSLLSLNLNAEKKTKNGFKKNMSLQIFNTVSNNLTVGGDIEFNIDKNPISNRLFANYKIAQNTLLKSKWEDNDKSFTFTLHHAFRDLLKFGVSGKFNIIRKNISNQLSCPIPQIKSKLGMSVEFDEAFF